ncbi:RNA polymerase sigma factor [Agrococcus baldri]|uniref:RNA polymerase sigma factor n=1 Tax=Agrococcus baldri TaxID=153730 RepID=UPI00296F430B|nr:RNA polymerase sigma factor [Agrococcus baldri]
MTESASRQREVEQVLRSVAPDLLGYFLRRTPSPEDAADMVSETLAATWLSTSKVPQEPEQARMWVFGVARNVLRHHHRSGSRRSALAEQLAAAVRQAQTTTVHGVDEDALDVQLAVAALPTQLAELIRLVHWDGFSIEQAARLQQIPASTARSRHARAKQLLKERLEAPVKR